jgi:hypothetical protein
MVDSNWRGDERGLIHDVSLKAKSIVGKVPSAELNQRAGESKSHVALNFWCRMKLEYRWVCNKEGEMAGCDRPPLPRRIDGDSR